MNEESLATELLREVKASAKRWFIAFLVMTAIEVFTIVGFIWYITLPVEEISEITQEVEDIDNSDIHQFIGDDYNGESKTDRP
jgi:hypothetical protein